MTSNEAKNEMEVMVLTDLAGICRKLAENSALTERLRVQARQFVEEFDSLLPVRGKDNSDHTLVDVTSPLRSLTPPQQANKWRKLVQSPVYNNYLFAVSKRV